MHESLGVLNTDNFTIFLTLASVIAKSLTFIFSMKAGVIAGVAVFVCVGCKVGVCVIVGVCVKGTVVADGDIVAKSLVIEGELHDTRKQVTKNRRMDSFLMVVILAT